jgi:hypothetical protein
MEVELGRGVAELLRGEGEAALTVELTIDFELDAQKDAVAFVGPGDPSLGYRCERVDGVEVWWRQRLVLATREPRVTDDIRPRRLLVDRVGKCLTARAEYA